MNYEDEKFADDFAFGLGQTVGCTFIDLIGDPLIGRYVQDKMAPQHKGAEIHARKAELVGDASAFLIFLGAQKYAPGLVKSIKRASHKILAPIYEKIGTNRLQEWADRHNVDQKSPEFRKKLEEWKDFQIENFAKASVISGASVITNVAIQKSLGNPRSVGVITTGKVIGATVTLGATLAIRVLIPRTMYHINEKISQHVVLPVIAKAHHILGINEKPHVRTDPLGSDDVNDKNFRTQVRDSKIPGAYYSDR